MIVEKNINRDIIENILRKSLKHRISFTKKEIKEIFKDFKLSAIKDKNIIIGCFLEKENEIHVAILKEFQRKWFSKKLFKELVSDLITKYGCVKTTMMPDNTEGMIFITKLGFIKRGDWYVYTPNKFLS